MRYVENNLVITDAADHGLAVFYFEKAVFTRCFGGELILDQRLANIKGYRLEIAVA